MIEKSSNKDATLYLGDCSEVLAELRGVDAVVTDPAVWHRNCFQPC